MSIKGIFFPVRKGSNYSLTYLGYNSNANYFDKIIKKGLINHSRKDFIEEYFNTFLSGEPISLEKIEELHLKMHYLIQGYISNISVLFAFQSYLEYETKKNLQSSNYPESKDVKFYDGISPNKIFSRYETDINSMKKYADLFRPQINKLNNKKGLIKRFFLNSKLKVIKIFRKNKSF